MRTTLFFSIIWMSYLAGCTPFSQVQPALPPLKRAPHFINFETGANIKSLAFDGPFLWLGLANGIIRYDTRTQDQYKIFTTRSTEGLLANGIYKVAIDPNQNKWVGTYGGGLSMYDGVSWQTFTPYGGGKITYDDAWAIYPAGSGLGDLWVYDIFFDTDGTAWIATWKGVSHYKSGSFKTYAEEAGLLDKWVYAIAKDRDGVLWFGTEGGLNSFDGQHWRGYTHQDGLGAKILSPEQTDDYESGHHRQHQKENRMGNPNYVLDIAVDHNNTKWVGTWGAGLSQFDGKQWTTYTAGNGTIGGNFVHALEVDSKGVLWIGTDHGVTRYDGKTWETYTTREGLLDNNVFSIAFDQAGNKWFGTWSGLSKMVD